MNKGTRIRTALFIITFLNQANVSLGVWEFGDERINTIYKLFSYLLSLGAGAAALWYNNDFTVEADTHTKLMREEKALRDHLPITVDEPDDAEVFEEESEVEHGDE